MFLRERGCNEIASGTLRCPRNDEKWGLLRLPKGRLAMTVKRVLAMTIKKWTDSKDRKKMTDRKENKKEWIIATKIKNMTDGKDG